MAELDFDANTVEPSKEFKVMPDGDQVFVIVASEMKPTKAGTGEYLALTFEVVKGEFKGRKHWENLNIHNPNAVAVRIARADLSSICRAVGVMVLKNSQQLHNLPFIGAVKCVKDDYKGDGSMKNVIKSYKSLSATTTLSSEPTLASGGSSPWKK